MWYGVMIYKVLRSKILNTKYQSVPRLFPALYSDIKSAQAVVEEWNADPNNEEKAEIVEVKTAYLYGVPGGGPA